MSTQETTSPQDRQPEKLAIWLQYPRRILLLLLAFAVALLLIRVLRAPLFANAPEQLEVGPEVDWSISWTMTRPVTEIIGLRLPNTLILLGASMFVALLLALVSALVGVLAHKLEERAGPLGSIVKGLGRLWVFADAAAPVYVLALFLILVFAIELNILPATGMYPIEWQHTGVRVSVVHLVLPVLSLSLLPATLTGQAMARAITLRYEQGGIRPWLAALCVGLGTLFGQTGGLLSAMMLAEMVFSWPGIGSLAIYAAMRLDLPVLLGMLSACAGLILAGRLVAELFHACARLAGTPLAAQPEPTRWRKTARTTWVVLALVLLLVPVGFAVAGLAIRPGVVHRTDLQSQNEPPSPEYPWGTDMLGRDVRARALRGALITLGMALLVAVATTLVGGPVGALSGFLANRRTLWAESLADLLTLPTDVLLFFPPILGAVAMRMMFGQDRNLPETSVVLVCLACALLLLPRAVRACRTLWTAAPKGRSTLLLVLAGLGAITVSTLFAGLALVAALDFVGLGIQPPTPSLGSMLVRASQMLRVNPSVIVVPGVVLWICAMAFYAAADALTGYFLSKEPLARMNE